MQKTRLLIAALLPFSSLAANAAFIDRGDGMIYDELSRGSGFRLAARVGAGTSLLWLPMDGELAVEI